MMTDATKGIFDIDVLEILDVSSGVVRNIPSPITGDFAEKIEYAGKGLSQALNELYPRLDTFKVEDFAESTGLSRLE